MYKRMSWLIIIAIVAGLFTFNSSTSEAQSPSKPILVVHNQANDGIFGKYIGELLKAEGINAFDMAEINTMNAALLASYDLVILGRSPLTVNQAADLTAYVNGGGRLIAMRPDTKLNSLAGLSTNEGLQVEGYLKIVNGAVFDGQTPGSGLTGETLQLHGSADRYTLVPGAVMLAELYSDAVTASLFPAVVGKVSGSGRMAAFTYDLPLNVIYTRQGNPANTGDTDGDGKVRTIDLFQGASGQPSWVDLNKIPIPQADEQIRFFGRLVKQLVNMPVPQLWYFPGTTKTMLIFTGDAHSNPASYYQTEIDSLNAYDAKITMYTPITAQLTDADVQTWRALGHEFGIHPYAFHPDPFDPYNITTLLEGYSATDAWFGATFSSPKSRTVRNHELAWLGYTDAVDLQVAHGIEMDANFYAWGLWLQKPDLTWAHGYTSGSGLPMKFAKLDGTILPVYQQNTQLVDEQMLTDAGMEHYENLTAAEGHVVSKALIDASEAGFYSALMTQFHVDYYDNGDPIVWAELMMAYAQSLHIPMWNADQWLTFTKLRDSSSFSNLVWNSTTGVLTFTLDAPAAPGSTLTTAVPIHYGGDTLVQVKIDGVPVAYSQVDVNGKQMAFLTVPAGNHNFSVRYHIDADLAITQIDNPDPVTAGENLVYTISVSKSGPDTAPNVEVTDTIPSGTSFVSVVPSQGSCAGTSTVTCSLGSITGSGSATITLTVMVNPSQRQNLSNTAVVSSQFTESNLTNNSITNQTAVFPDADLSISISDAPDPVIAGTNLVYSLMVNNVGPSTATGVSVTQNLPAGVSYVNSTGTGWACTALSGSVKCDQSNSISVGGSAAGLVIDVSIDPGMVPGIISSTATVNAAENDTNPGNDSASATTEVTGSADLGITISANGDPVRVGSPVQYTLTVNNLGVSSAASVTTTIHLPLNAMYVSASGTNWNCAEAAGVVTCTLSQLLFGLANPITIDMTTQPSGSSLVIEADVNSVTGDPVMSNNSMNLATGLQYMGFLPLITYVP